jgi:hypothetical protein
MFLLKSKRLCHYCSTLKPHFFSMALEARYSLRRVVHVPSPPDNFHLCRTLAWARYYLSRVVVLNLECLSMRTNDTWPLDLGVTKCLATSPKSWPTFHWFTGHCNCSRHIFQSRQSMRFWKTEVSRRNIRKRTGNPQSSTYIATAIYLPWPSFIVILR